MRIIEDISYSIDDMIDAINEELGFAYIKSSEDTGYINLGQGIKLEFEFNTHKPSVTLVFPNKEINVTKSVNMMELYSSAIESTAQILDVIDRMTPGHEDEDIE